MEQVAEIEVSSGGFLAGFYVGLPLKIPWVFCVSARVSQCYSRPNAGDNRTAPVWHYLRRQASWRK